jgi:hypothetical protein
MADGTEAGIIIPAYWSGDNSKFARAAAVMPSGTILCGAPGFDNALPWYGSDSAPTGTGSGQSQTRDGAAAATIATCHAAGLKVLPYIAMHSGEAGTGFDGHYTDLNAVLGKIDKAYALYPEYDGIFCDETPIASGGASFMAAVVARIHSHGGIAVGNMASYQVYDGAINYGDYVTIAETAWDSSQGEGGPYGSITNSGDSNFIGQPSFVDSWPRGKIVYWIFGVPNVPGMARTARKLLYENHNVGNIYLSNFSPYFERWASPASDPLFTEQAQLSGAVINPAPGPPAIGGVRATVAGDGTTAAIVATASEPLTYTVDYGLTSGYGSSVGPLGPATLLAATLTGLTPGQTYHYRITGTDADSNVVTTPDATFLAQATPDPTPSPTPDAPAAAIRAIEESPFASGQVAAVAGNALLRSFDRGANWNATLKYADAALVAQRLATAHFADLTRQADYAWVAFAGTSSNVQSRILNEAGRPSVDWPNAAKPAQPTGLTLGLSSPAMYLADTGGAGTGRTWALDDFTGGGTLEARAYNAAYGPPRHIVRDGAIDALIFGAADAAVWKSYDGFLSVVRLLELVSPRVGRMVGFGRLRHAPAPTGDLYASAYLSDTNQALAGRTQSKIIRLAGATWSAVADHPIPTSEHPNLLLGQGYCNFSCTLSGSLSFDEALVGYPRPLIAGHDGAFYTYCCAVYAENVSGCTPGYHNLYKSTDKGATWAALTGVSGVTSLDVAADGALWAVCDDGAHVKRSTNGGATWAQLLDTPASQGFGNPAFWQFLNRWVAVACSPSSAGAAVVSCHNGFARTTNATAPVVTWANTAIPDTGNPNTSWGLARSPTDGATILNRRRIPGNDTFRVADGTADASGSAAVLTGTGSGDDNTNTYRRLGGRVFYLGHKVLGSDTYVSTDDGRSWAALLGAGADGLGVTQRAGRDVAYDAATDALYVGLAAPQHDPGVTVAFLVRAGIGAWQDLTGAMLAALGGTYAAHPLGMIAGVR